jgi:diaminohydroxyphosphoribosylaminopyrimidine deaminase/5-amino-6-(5-phosphoribosylamino)uracil reductase
MREAGITVETDCLAEEGLLMNRRFFGFLTNKRPYIILKWAQTTDGYIDLEREPGDSEGPRWITDSVNRTLVHKWRSEEAAIMVGTNTIIADNPGLDVRRWTGENPIRVTMDRKGRLARSAQIFNGKQETIVFTGVPKKYPGRTRSIHADLSYQLEDVLEELYDQKVISVFVEGGAQLHTSFIESGLWDEARVFTGKMAFSQGVKAPEMNISPEETLYISDTKLELYMNKIVN